MEKPEDSLLQKRSELKQAFEQGSRDSFPSFLFEIIGRGTQRVFRLKRSPGWLFSATLLFLLLIYVPGFLIALLMGELQQWQGFQLFYFGLIPFGYCSSIACYINVTYNLLPGIRNNVIDSIMTIEDLNKLETWLKGFWSIPKSFTFSLVTGSLTAIAFISTLSFASGNFLGFGLTTLTLLVAPFYVGALYIIFHTITLPILLSEFELRLYESDPLNSEIIQRLIHFLNIYVYWVAGYTAVGTALVSLNPITAQIVWIALFIGWIPTVIQFLTIQYALRKIIVTGKWQNLNKLQAQIKELQNMNLVEASETTITRLNQLLDLHDRLSAKPNSNLNLGTGLSFLNQLMLPLLGLLLGNLDKILKLLNIIPAP